MEEQELKAFLADMPIPDLRYFNTIGSTNDEAMDWAEHGAPEGAFVIADQQTSGRGRNQRKWITRPDAALAFSIIFRPEQGPRPVSPAFYSPMCALAVCQMLEGVGLHPQIKWPNDVLLDRKKIGGILVEGAWQDQSISAVICGIGINIASNSVLPSDGVLFPASSLELELGRAMDRWQVLKAVLRGLFHWRARIGAREFLQAWESRLAFRGEWVRVGRDEQEPLIGKVDGIDAATGSLRLITASARIELIEAGDVHLRLAETD